MVASAQPDGAGRAVAAHKAAGHEDGEPCGHALEHRCDENAAEHEGHAVLQDLCGSVEHEGVAHSAEHILKTALAAPAQIHGGEQHGDEDAGIARGLGAERHPVQAERAENDADEAGDERRGDEQVLQERNAGSDDLSEDEQR